MTRALHSAKGSENNRVKIGGLTELYGDPAIKSEKPYTIILGPGFSVEISRCEDGGYWIHAATREASPNSPKGNITEARIDADGVYLEVANKVFKEHVDQGIVNHFAVRVHPSALEDGS